MLFIRVLKVVSFGTGAGGNWPSDCVFLPHTIKSSPTRSASTSKPAIIIVIYTFVTPVIY